MDRRTGVDRRYNTARKTTNSQLALSISTETTSDEDSDITLLEPLARSAYHEQYLSVFWTSYLPNGRSFPGHAGRYSNGVWINEIQRYFYLNASGAVVVPLKKILLATALATAAKEDPRQEGWMMRASLRLHGDALAGLAGQMQVQMRDETGLSSEVCLATTRLLSLYEILHGHDIDHQQHISQVRNWHTHIQGGMGFMLARGPDSYTSGFAHQLFVDDRSTQVSASLITRTHSILNSPALKTIPWKNIRKSPKDLLGDIFAEIPGLFVEVEELRYAKATLTGHDDSTEKQEHVLDLVTRLQSQCLSWKAHHAPSTNPVIPSPDTVSPDQVFNHLLSAHTMVGYWTMGLIFSAVFDIVSGLLIPGEFADLDDELDARRCCQRVIEILSTLLHPYTGELGIHGAIFPCIVALEYLEEMDGGMCRSAEARAIYEMFGTSAKARKVGDFVQGMRVPQYLTQPPIQKSQLEDGNYKFVDSEARRRDLPAHPSAVMLTTYILGSLLAYIVLFACDSDPFQDFKSPSAEYRTRYRYWIPDASVNITSVISDIEAIKTIGGGGIQFLPFYNFGFNMNPTELPYAAWTEYAFGSEPFKEVFKTAVNASKANDLGFTFFIGGSQGQGVPSEPLTKGLAVHLVYGSASVSGGEVFDGPIPVDNATELNFHLSDIGDFMHGHEEFGAATLVGVVAAGVVSSMYNGTSEEGDVFFMVSIDEDSLVDLTDLVQDGQLTWEAPGGYDNYTLFAFYERYTNQRAVDAALGAEDIIANGSWVTDHFSSTGAQLVIDFWEEQILDDEMRELLAQVGEHSIEDSMELASGLWWSESLHDRFQALHGYSPVKYLPLLFHQAHSYRIEYPPYNRTYILSGDENPADNKYLQDYRKALSDGYNEYLATFEEWAHTLGLTHSARPAYHLPLDMPSSMPYITTPELESLAFPTTDSMLQFTGPVHMVNSSTLISTELGSVFPAYSLSAGELMIMAKKAFAGGVTSIVLQAMAYSGEYVGTTWPGLTAVAFFTGDGWNPRYPDWRYLDDFFGYVARNQRVLREGAGKKGLAIYSYKEPWDESVEYEGSELRGVGLSYEYLGPTNLASPEAVVDEKGVLASDGPGYRALVLDHQDYITAAAAQNVVEFARHGLPIVVIGDAPSIAVGSTGQDLVTAIMESLANYSNVAFITDEDSLPDTLRSLGVEPRLSVQDLSTSSGSESEAPAAGEDDPSQQEEQAPGQDTNYTLTFNNISADKVPYHLNAWTGEQQAWSTYQRTDAGVLLNVSLAADQTTIFAFMENTECDDVAGVHAISQSPNVKKIDSDGETATVYILDSNAAIIALSTGEMITIPASSENESILSSELQLWNLTIESWVPDANNTENTYSVIEEIHLGEQSLPLRPWLDISESAQNVSGVGIYTTSFTLPTQSNTDTANEHESALLLNLGSTPSTIRAWINEHPLPPLDVSKPEILLTLTDAEYLVQGENTLRVEVSSNLFNAVRSRITELRTGGDGEMVPGTFDEEPLQGYGLTGSPKVKGVRVVRVEL
ncbi:hypothetical protein BDW74DRAFT_181570 [Aspergillus multicolor]|uniref:uncharacterized protein n=1 Tax=Aspergillus multicolor TaxID=41759 RepID=UPI003CCDBB5A